MNRLLIVAVAIVVFLSRPAVAQNPALEGYADYAAFAERVIKLDASDIAAVTSLGKTTGERELFVVTLGRGDASKKPAIVLLGNTAASHVVGSELALRMAERMVAEPEQESFKKLLEAVTIYVIPRPDPDATEKAFAPPFREAVGNLRKTDDDRDGHAGEDPPNDLNGDGWITMMRIEDPAGIWMPHPADPRVLIEADIKKNEHGRWRMYTEGRDDDNDEQQSEDPGDGVAFNRNWPHRYQPFQVGTGPNAVSEVESRAIAGFLFDRTNVFSVFCFSPDDNLFHSWKPDAGKDKQRIRTTVLSSDAPFLDFLAGKYRDLHGGKDAPESIWPGGTFAEWSYFQYGRWTFSARGWWAPKIEPAADGKKPEDRTPEEKKVAEEKRGSDDLNMLRWFAQEKIPGFVDWVKVEHPDLPGKSVEVGGFKPFYRQNPPIKLVDELAGKHVSFIAQLAEHRPQLALRETKIESLGSNVFRVTAKLASSGYLPTLSEMGEVTGVHQRLQIQLFTPEKTVLLKGPPRVKLGRIDAAAERETTWLIRLPEAKGVGKVRAWSPEIGQVESDLRFE